jgi:peptidoglycan/LPS O-acetylase OafA/YrhL
MKVYKTLCILTSLLYFYLFYTLLFNSSGLCADLGLEGNEVVYFLARRASALMLGFGVLLLLARNLKEPKSRAIISTSVAVCMLGLATMSGYEFFRGFVNSGMVPPMIIELTLGLAFLILGFTNIKKEKQSCES